MRYLSLLLILDLFVVLSCATTNNSSGVYGKYATEKITSQTPTSRMINIALDQGADSIELTRKYISARNDWPKVMPSLESMMKTLSPEPVKNQERLLRALNIYMGSNYPASSSFFDFLIKSDHPFHYKLGLILAANMPDRKVAEILDSSLSLSVQIDDQQKLQNPLLARAITANRMKSSYSVLRVGLMQTGNENFAEAMLELNPTAASNDFLDYLALVSTEELRQLTIKTVNVLTCSLILKHFVKYPPSIGHTNFTQLFYYSVSRNQSLSQLAMQALSVHLKNNRVYVATILARMPVWLQVAFVENMKYDLTRDKRLFAMDFRRVTTNEDVIYEIDSIKN